jgi:pimeloyl-ACP methyl ester carboxylesterase
MKFAKLALGVLSLPTLLIAYVGLRHVVYWSPSEEVTFDSGDIALAGTLIKPASSGTFPAVVLLHGSGPETRSDPQTRVVVNVLVRNGFAVLLYDKRGVAASGGNFELALYPDFVSDAIAAVEYITTRKDIDARLIGLYAVSEGAWLAPEVAARTGNVAFIFNKVGSPLPAEECWLWETGNEYIGEGYSQSDTKKLVDLARLRWDYYQDAAADPSLAAGPRRDAINAEIARVFEEIPNAENAIRAELLPFDQEVHTRFAANSGYDPGPFIEQLDIPMFYTLGEHDENLPTAQSVAALKLLIESGKNIEYRVFTGVGHGLATWRGALQFGYVPGYLNVLDEWTAARDTELRQHAASPEILL